MPRPEKLPPTEEAEKIEALRSEFKEFCKFKVKDVKDELILSVSFFGAKIIQLEHRIKQLEDEVYKK